MKTYEDVFGDPHHDLGPDFELRDIPMWRVHCRHCGFMRIGDIPQTDKSFAAVQRLLAANPQCRNPSCVTNGGHERRRQKHD